LYELIIYCFFLFVFVFGYLFAKGIYGAVGGFFKAFALFAGKHISAPMARA
jgi:hypothetical protein